VNSGAPERYAVPAPLASVHTFHGVRLQDFSCPAHVDVGGDMTVMSMVDKIYMYIRSLKRETQQVLHDCYVAQEKPMPVSKLTCEKFPVVRRGIAVQIQQICFGL
jgi:hypothetical protein